MPSRVDTLQASGTKEWAHLTATTREELEDMARRLRVPVKDSNKGKEPHLDLNKHKRDLAIRYGAEE